MTKKELVVRLNEFPDDMEVWLERDYENFEVLTNIEQRIISVYTPDEEYGSDDELEQRIVIMLMSSDLRHSSPTDRSS